MMSSIGRSLELYYIDGRPDGMLTAELFNWTGHVLMAPRTQIANALRRSEAGYAGVYILMGEQDGEPLAYVGEGEDISARIKAHDVKKEWWTEAVLITAAANKLNKAHVRYLESRLIAIAKDIGRVPLENGVSPACPVLSEADIAKMEAFLENIFVVLPAVRVDMFIQRARPAFAPSPKLPSAAPDILDDMGGERFKLELKREQFTAEAALTTAGEFVVLAGSQARPIKGSSPYTDLYNELLRASVIVPDGTGLRFAQSYVFKSPSAAASVALGRSTNGPTAWRHERSGLTYKAWEAEKLDKDLMRLLGGDQT